MNEYTEFCLSKLRACLGSECPEFVWMGEETIYGEDLTTRVDICGKDNERTVLVQFEMHREGVATNALKLAYCLEGNRRFEGKQVLMLHVLSPFCEKPGKSLGEPEKDSVPDWVAQADREKWPGFRTKMEGKDTRIGGRRIAYTHRLLCLFLKQKGVLDTAATTYHVVEWNLDDFPEVRKATIVLPDKELFPARTEEAIAVLAKQLGKVIKE